jgi:propionyl-CoA carboxylase alpha chain
VLSGYKDPLTTLPRDGFLAHESAEIRCDAGVTHGSEISMFYDPMICKLITHGPTRDLALDRLRASLDAYTLRGLGHNIAFLRDLTEHPRFIEGRIDTGFIKAEYPTGFHGVQLSPGQTHHLVAAAAVMNFEKQLAGAQVSGATEHAHPPEVHTVVVSLGRRTAMTVDGKEKVTLPRAFVVEVEVGHADPAAADAVAAALPHATAEEWRVTIQEVDYTTDKPIGKAGVVKFGGVDWTADSDLFLAYLGDGIGKDGAHTSRTTLRVQHNKRHEEGFALSAYGANAEVYVRSPLAHALSKIVPPLRVRDMGRVIASPMPGALISVAVSEGDEVEEGQEIAVMEAMKMQNVLRAPKKTTIKKVCAKAGDTLALDQIIVELA